MTIGRGGASCRAGGGMQSRDQSLLSDSNDPRLSVHIWVYLCIRFLLRNARQARLSRYRRLKQGIHGYTQTCTDKYGWTLGWTAWCGAELNEMTRFPDGAR